MAKAIRLPKNHRRSLSVTARMVEQTLDEMEELLRKRGEGKLTSEVDPTYSEHERARSLAVIAEMRRVNAEMFRTLDLERSRYAEDQVIHAKKTHIWTILVDSRSARLGGYGELTGEVGRAVDTHVDRLLELLKDLP